MKVLNHKITCHKHDVKWIEERLKQLPSAIRPQVIGKYSEVYNLTVAEGGIGAVTKARREANTRLRNYIDRLNNNQK